jgi:hypothetical protein
MYLRARPPETNVVSDDITAGDREGATPAPPRPATGLVKFVITFGLRDRDSGLPAKSKGYRLGFLIHSAWLTVSIILSCTNCLLSELV